VTRTDIRASLRAALGASSYLLGLLTAYYAGKISAKLSIVLTQKLGQDTMSRGAVMQPIADWLKNLGMSEYAQRFAENDIDIAVLPDLTDQHLKDLGVSLGHRLKMLHAIRELTGDISVTAQPPVVPESKPQDAAERRQITVMFCDLVGSTALSARLDPEDMREIIGAYHRCCAEQITKSGGFVAKYMGDGVLAYFGYPQAHEDDAERAVRGALTVIEAVPKLRAGHDAVLQVRAGIATGLVVVGDLIGEGDAQERGVVGDTPNLAARLQALAEPGQVVISQSTRRLTGGLFDYHDLGRVALKGLAEPAQAWRVLGPSAAESRFEAQHGTGLTPLVGREEELELLTRRWQRAKAGEGSVVLVSGEAGIGKSRVVQALLERLSAEPYTRLRTFCSPHHQDAALYPTVTQLERAAGFRRDDSDEQRLDKLEALLAQATNNLGDAGPLLAALLSIPTGERYPALDLTPQKRKEKTLLSLVAQLEGLAARQPVLMAVEDAHWIDPTSLELLDLIIERTAALPVLLTITYRPEFKPPWIGRSHVTSLVLNRLPRRQRVEMVARVTEGKALPREIADQIVERTDGIPLFIEELTKAVVESGELADAGDHYTATRSMSSLTIPTTLHASLLARLDRLAPVREVAQIGAALGRQFSHELISAVAAMPQTQLDNAVGQLVGAELMYRRGTPPNAEYTFKHALVQDAAYSTLLRSRRQGLHGRIVAVLEGQFPEIAASEPARLAQHCAEAALNEKAIGYWHKAGLKAAQRSANREAVGHLTKALDLLRAVPDTAERASRELALQRLLGAALMATSGFSAPETVAAFSRARELTRIVADDADTYPMLWGVWTSAIYRANHAVAREVAEEIIARAQGSGDPENRIVGNVAGGFTDLVAGSLAPALGHYEQAIGLYEIRSPEASLADRYPIELGAIAYAYSAWCRWLLGQPDKALQFIQQVKAVVDRAQHGFTTARALYWTAVLHQFRGEWAIVDAQSERLIQLAEDQSYAMGVAVGRILQGAACAVLRSGEVGMREMRAGLAAYSATGARVEQPYYLTLLAEAMRAQGLIEEGLAVLDEASDRVQQTGERYFEAEIHRTRGSLLLARRKANIAESAASYQRALEVARAQEARSFELRASTSLARLWRDQGKRTEARDVLAPIYGWFTEGFDTADLKEAKALLDELA
jgi:class 3 adenylate cyclase/predicted ATPase